MPPNIINQYSPESPTAASRRSAVLQAWVKQKEQDSNLGNFGSGMFAAIIAKANDSETIRSGASEPPAPPPPEHLERQSESETQSTGATQLDVGWLHKSILRLNELRTLPANWDSYGAEPPNPIICDLVQRTLFDLRELNLPEPFLAPVANGSIYLKFKVPPREIGIEFDDPSGRYASCLFVRNMPREELREKAIHLATEFKSAIFWLLGENQHKDLAD